MRRLRYRVTPPRGSSTPSTRPRIINASYSSPTASELERDAIKYAEDHDTLIVRPPATTPRTPTSTRSTRPRTPTTTSSRSPRHRPRQARQASPTTASRASTWAHPATTSPRPGMTATTGTPPEPAWPHRWWRPPPRCSARPAPTRSGRSAPAAQVRRRRGPTQRYADSSTRSWKPRSATRVGEQAECWSTVRDTRPCASSSTIIDCASWRVRGGVFVGVSMRGLSDHTPSDLMIDRPKRPITSFSGARNSTVSLTHVPGTRIRGRGSAAADQRETRPLLPRTCPLIARSDTRDARSGGARPVASPAMRPTFVSVRGSYRPTPTEKAERMLAITLKHLLATFAVAAGVLTPAAAASAAGVTDGTSNTIMFAAHAAGPRLGYTANVDRPDPSSRTTDPAERQKACNAGLLMGDTGLEPVTSALSRRRSPS